MRRIKSEFDLDVGWIRKGDSGSLVKILGENSVNYPKNRLQTEILERISKTNALGSQPLWDGYGDHNRRGPTRRPRQVQTHATHGNFFAHLVGQLSPDNIVEFGTAFGVSGMYFLSGIESAGTGRLLTFEPNEVWAEIADANLSSISSKYSLTNGTFEENIGDKLDDGAFIDLAFIDAIHVKEFVDSQLEIVLNRSRPGTVVLIDDINFSKSMQVCWQEISNQERFLSSASLGTRVGIVELS